MPGSEERDDPRGRWGRLSALAALYFVQGLPFGFQATALPVYLRAEGVSLAGVGLATLVSAPWMLKALWAPAVDRFGSERLGRRRSWILPTQLGLAACCVVAAFVPPDGGLVPLLGVVLAMNLFAATMDIAVDGLAVSLLAEGELGYGNIGQVVGYKLGMLTGGGLLVWASAWIGWPGLFLAMAGFVLVVFAGTLLVPEPGAARREDAAGLALRETLRLLLRSVRAPGGALLLAFVATYKLGETMADLLFKPLLVDAGFTPGQIGLWVGTWGMVASLAGSFVGGVVASRLPLLRAVGALALLRAIPVAGELWLSLLDAPSAAQVIGVTVAEHFFGGALTTAMFAFMMSRVDRRIGATHYTVLATVEVLGKMPGAAASGALAQALGYAPVFGLALGLSVAYLGLLPPMARAAARPAQNDVA